MSYALGQVQVEGISVGSRAAQDPILARASLEASQVLLQVAKLPRAQRPAAILRVIGKRYGSKVRRAYEAKLAGAKTDQAVYDAIRLALANHYTRIGLHYLQKAMVRKYGGRFIPKPLDGLRGLGDLGTTAPPRDEGKEIGCAIGGGATVLLSAIIGGYTAGAGAPLVGAGGAMAMQAAGCGAEQQAAQQDLAAAQAAAAAAAAAQAAQAAAVADREAAEKRKTMITVAAIGGGALLLLGVGYMIVKA